MAPRCRASRDDSGFANACLIAVWFRVASRSANP